jgi:NAD(P)-dependent dehydrogenase (short-subunit alcohol dehydrogenase family)
MMQTYSFLNKNLFKNKVVLVTGGSGQLGHDICKFYLKLGCKVYSLDISSKLSKKKNLKQLTLDVSNKKECKTIINSIIKKEKKIDILVNNAGTSIFSHFIKRTDEELDNVYATNLKGTINMIIEVSKNHKKNNKLHIINIGSIYGSCAPDLDMYRKGDRMNSEIYGATKAGIIQLTKYFAKALSSRGTFCNCISPGGIKSDKTQTNKFQKRYIEKLAIKRMATTIDVIFAIYYLSNPANQYVTGQNLIVDGGYSI